MAAGVPFLALTDVALVDELRVLLERVDSANYYRTGERIACAQRIVPAARAVVDLAALLTSVPTAEPANDERSGAGAAWITTQQAAASLQISERAVRKRIAAGSLLAEKRSGVWLIRTESLTNAA